GIVPIVGEVLVVEDWHRALALLEGPDNLLVHPPARQQPVSLEIGWIVSVFSDYDDTIYRKFGSAKPDGLTYGLMDGYLFRRAYFLAQQACFILMDVNRDDVHSRRRVNALPPI